MAGKPSSARREKERRPQPSAVATPVAGTPKLDRLIHERLRLIWADAGYAGHLIEWMFQKFGSRLSIEIVRRMEEHRFSVVKRRWIVERTFGWLCRCRRLSKDYEALTRTSENWIRMAMIGVMIKRLTPAAFQPT